MHRNLPEVQVPADFSFLATYLLSFLDYVASHLVAHDERHAADVMTAVKEGRSRRILFKYECSKFVYEKR